MADYSSKPAVSLAIIKASVIVMAVLIALGLGLIAAKLILDARVGDGERPQDAGQSVEFPRIVHMAGANGLIVMVIETTAGRQVVRIFDPVSGSVTDQPLDSLVK